ncbi:MAG: PaaI family thioesterase [Lachnospiraceae bacterium]|nr:PaaI family thioesterase [Lachnospiraceae bacterium]
MRKADSEETERLRDYLIDLSNGIAINRFLGIEFLELNKNYCKTRIKYSDNLTNPYNTVHGGVLAVLADATAGVAACMCGRYTTTVSANLNYLLPAADTENIYCEAMKLKSGKHIFVFDVRITDDKGNILDSGEFSFFVTGKKI